eukprot:m.15360 g.15360  ORF g.15360 m.15360 type:complete len:472 (-) comp4462_c0_seq1:257-1672(-)
MNKYQVESRGTGCFDRTAAQLQAPPLHSSAIRYFGRSILSPVITAELREEIDVLRKFVSHQLSRKKDNGGVNHAPFAISTSRATYKNRSGEFENSNQHENDGALDSNLSAFLHDPNMSVSELLEAQLRRTRKMTSQHSASRRLSLPRSPLKKRILSSNDEPAPYSQPTLPSTASNSSATKYLIQEPFIGSSELPVPELESYPPIQMHYDDYQNVTIWEKEETFKHDEASIVRNNNSSSNNSNVPVHNDRQNQTTSTRYSNNEDNTDDGRNATSEEEDDVDDEDDCITIDDSTFSSYKENNKDDWQHSNSIADFLLKYSFNEAHEDADEVEDEVGDEVEDEDSIYDLDEPSQKFFNVVRVKKHYTPSQAATIIAATYRGYLVRRMLRTAKCVSLIQTVKDSVELARELQHSHDRVEHLLYTQTLHQLNTSKKQLGDIVHMTQSQRIHFLSMYKPSKHKNETATKNTMYNATA